MSLIGFSQGREASRVFGLTRPSKRFDPSTYGRHLWWFDADNLHVGSCERWPNRSGSGDAVQATSSLRPAVQAGALNNSNGLLFDGTDDYLQLATATLTDFTVIFAARLKDTVNDSVWLGSSASSSFYVVQRGGAARVDVNTGSGQSQLAYPAGRKGLTNIIIARRAGTQMTIGLNGSRAVSTNSGSLSFDRIGYYSVGGFYADGWMGTLCLFPTALSDGALRDLEVSLMERHGVI